MASSSTSSIHKSFKYDVFLSFRGEDTRTNFVDHLYYALQQKSIHTYKDDERIKKGKRISDELIRSIEESKFYIIVFSKNYASSSWCLDELVEIMECHKTNEHTAYPVFYDVEPSEVRKQSGIVKEAFSKHENEEGAEKWREALKEAADLAGWELKNTADRHEAKFIQKVVEELSLELRSISVNVDEKLVGMESRVKEVVSSLATGSDDVRMIGIKGIGGGGKTTLARAVFDQISFQFEGKSFVENVREVSNASLSGLKSLQNQVLLDVLDDKNISISSVSDGKHMMRRRMRGKKVIVVLDDVDHIDQLEALAGEPNWFMSGSRIIITTRDEQVLVAHHVKLILDVNLLSDKEAISLFRRYAFGRDIPNQGYEELSQQVVRYAGGLPLTIKVLGSFLCGKDELEWIDSLERLKTIPLAETLKKLELSYIGLEDDYKEIFLDIACIVKGWPKDNVIKALESCGFHARNGLKVLEQKSLITISSNDDNYILYVRVHDHIEEMGRNIVRRLHPDKPHKHTRLWNYEEIENVLSNDLGTKATRYMRLDTQIHNRKFDIKGLTKMKELRFLSVGVADYHYWESNIVNQEFPNALRFLRLQYYPYRSLPISFEANNLVSLEMVDSEIVQLWEGGETKILNKLRFLDLSRSKLTTLDLRLTPNLENLALAGCSNLVQLHMPVGGLKLIYFNLSHTRLRTLDLGLALNLYTLMLIECNALINLRMPTKCLNLRHLAVTNSKLMTLDIGLTPNLEFLNLKDCCYLYKLSMAGDCEKLANLDISYSKLRTIDLGLFPNLLTLNLQECWNLVEVHAPIGCLKKLVHFELSGRVRFRSLSFNAFLRVEGSLADYPLADLHMTVKSLERCPFHPNNNLPKFRFTCIYKDRHSLTGNLEMLLSIGMCACTNLEKLSQTISGLRSLRKLKLEGNILEAPKDLDRLECLEELILCNTKINYLPDSICMLKNLKSLELESCWLLEMLPKDLGRLECLENLTLSSTMIKHLPDSICMLKRLKSLKLISCWLLEKLPENLDQLECLEILTWSSSMIKHLPGGIFVLKNLKSLNLSFFWVLEKLPENLGQLECLEKLTLSSSKIKHLPDSICMLKHLKSLKLYPCLLLENLPEDLGRLECLEELDLSYTKIKHLPDSVCMLKHLKSLKVDHCPLLEKLPQSIHLLKGLRIAGSRRLLESCGLHQRYKQMQRFAT